MTTTMKVSPAVPMKMLMDTGFIHFSICGNKMTPKMTPNAIIRAVMMTQASQDWVFTMSPKPRIRVGLMPFMGKFLRDIE